MKYVSERDVNTTYFLLIGLLYECATSVPEFFVSEVFAKNITSRDISDAFELAKGTG
jgi:hypothetical protein